MSLVSADTNFKPANVKVPAFAIYAGGPHKFDPTTVQLDSEGYISLDGTRIGRIGKGSYRYSPPTHKGSRIARYHSDVSEWQAVALDNTKGMPVGREYKGGVYGDKRKNTRRAAIAYVIAVHGGVSPENARYFTWNV
jgi:hypothetical protein